MMSSSNILPSASNTETRSVFLESFIFLRRILRDLSTEIYEFGLLDILSCCTMGIKNIKIVHLIGNKNKMSRDQKKG